MAKTIGMLFGWIYIIVGIAGFIPAIGGSDSLATSTLLSVAPTNLLHNIVHLIIGLAGVTMSRTAEGAGTFCKTFGVILVVIGILGYFVPNLFGILPIGGNDVWIHLVTGAVLAWAGFAAAPSRGAVAS